MAFEGVVRPVVFPDIRPAPAQPLPPPSDPTKGLCVIKGTGAQVLSLSYSYSYQSSKSNHTETQRRVDVARVYQMDDDGNVNRDNFIDMEVANKVWMSGSPISRYSYAPIQEDDNIEILERNKIKRPDE